ncbi:hypothetical protein DMI70_17620 [Escherichia coli]|nr:hypothetical protein [Escherichia coli]
MTVTRSFTFIVFLLWLCASVEQFRFLAAPRARVLIFDGLYLRGCRGLNDWRQQQSNGCEER